MKILKITFENINSLKGRHEIDFSAAPFNANSLFAITGPTGSGKSTILDVISLALFNQVPRLGKISKNEIISKGAILTRNQKEAFAQVTYESKSGKFASEWSISTNRNGNLRDYEMQLYNLETGKAFDLKKSDVPAKNEELIGLNYEQFIKAVLLAQGEFAQFLKAKKDERGELLEKITGTGIYRQLGIRAFQKYKEENLEKLEQQREIELIKRDLLDEESHKKHVAELSEKETACKPLQETLEKLKKSLELKGKIKEQQKEIENFQNQKSEAEEALKLFEKSQGEKLLQHEKVQPFAEEIRNWQQLEAICNELDAEIGKKDAETGKNKENLDACLEELCNFTKQNIEADQFEASLDAFSKKINDLLLRKKEKLDEHQNTKHLFEIETREIGFQLNGKPEENELKLKELQISSNSRLLQLEENLKDVDLQIFQNERTRLQQELQTAQKATKQAGQLENISAEIRKIETEEAKLSEAVKNLPQQISEAKNKRELLSERVEKLVLKQQNQILAAELEQHRHRLKDGEACPLCGALEHPYATELPPRQEGLDAEIQQTKSDLSNWERKLASWETELEGNNKRLADFQNQKKLLKENFQNQKLAFDEAFQQFKNLTENQLEQHCERTQKQLANLEQYEQEKRKSAAIAAGLPLLEKLKKIVSEGKTISEDLKSLYSGSDINADANRLQTSWTRLQEEQKALQKQLKEVRDKSVIQNKKWRELEENLQPKLLERDCENVKEAVQMLLPDTQYTQLRNQREQLKSAIEKASTVLKTLQDQLEKIRKSDLPKAEESLVEEMEQNAQSLSGLNTECEELRRKLNNHRDQLEKMQKLEAQISDKAKKIKRWRLLNELIGDATGKKFNDFAQDLTLGQLLTLANIRLKDLSDRYLIDKPEENEDDGLVAIDEHMGGQRRSVKTLSGGETFILSLSMALALSDLASKNVEINSLFIDEGFGTLDPETLDQTLDTLEKLQAESSKTIGIISHVDSLKERIATQIQLKRNGQGYSQLEVK